MIYKWLFFLYFCLQEAAMLAFHWSRKILRILLNFCPNCGIHDNAKAAQPESADAACFPLTSQHSSVQTQWTCRWQLGTSAGSIHFTILQLWCGHSALDVSAINFRKPQTNNRGWMQTIQVMGHSKGWPCYELMQSKKHIHTHCPTIFAGAAGTLALNEHSFQAAVQKLAWQSKDISQPHLASVSVWPHTHCLAKQVMSIVYDGSYMLLYVSTLWCHIRTDTNITSFN